MKEEKSVKESILDYLSLESGWKFGGTIDTIISARCKVKASNVGRQCRLLYGEDKIDRQLVKIDGKGPNVVQYKSLSTLF